MFFIEQSFVTPSTFALPTFVLINTMSCHLYRNVQLGLYRDYTGHLAHAETFQGALEGSSSSDQQHQIGIAFSLMRSGYDTHLTQEIDLEAARDDGSLLSREGVEVGNAKERITEKADV